MGKPFIISSFPEDNVVRVLYRYGGIQKNSSGTTISPHIQVLLIEIDKQGNLVTQNFVLTYIKLHELHKAKLGSVWKGQNFLSKDFNLNGQIRSREFIFRFYHFLPKNVDFDFVKKQFRKVGYNPDILRYFNYPYLHINDKYTEKKFEDFEKANYALLTSTKKYNVFISSIEVLNSLFCGRASLKEKLLFSSIDDIVNEYLENYEILNDRDSSYKIKIRSNKKNLGDKTLKFLAFLALNKRVRNTVSLIQSSLEDIEYDPYNYKNVTRFPIILPPQTVELRIKTLGFEYGNNFFVTKIKNVESVYDHTVLYEENKDSNSY